MRSAIFDHRSRATVIVAADPSRGRTASSGSRQSSRPCASRLRASPTLRPTSSSSPSSVSGGIRAWRASSSDSSAVPVAMKAVKRRENACSTASASVAGGSIRVCSAAASSVRPSIASSSSRPHAVADERGFSSSQRCIAAGLVGILDPVRASKRRISREPSQAKASKARRDFGDIVATPSATPAIAPIAALTGHSSSEAPAPRSADSTRAISTALMPATQLTRLSGPPSAAATSTPRGWKAGRPGGDASVAGGYEGAAACCVLGSGGRTGAGGDGGAELSCGWSVMPADCRGSR